MPSFVERGTLRLLLEQGVQLVDVLGREEFARSHLPGAINIPLREIDSQARARLQTSVPVVVYCNDYA